MAEYIYDEIQKKGHRPPYNLNLTDSDGALTAAMVSEISNIALR